MIPYLNNVSAEVTPDGSAIGLRFTTKTGQVFDCALSVADAQKFLAVMISRLQDAATKHAATPQGAAMPPPSLTATPINARGIGIASGRNANEQLFAIDLGPFQLTFAVPSGKIQQLH